MPGLVVSSARLCGPGSGALDEFVEQGGPAGLVVAGGMVALRARIGRNRVPVRNRMNLLPTAIAAVPPAVVRRPDR